MGWILGAALLILLLWFWYFENNSIVVTRAVWESEKAGPGLDGLRIAQVSDLHNKDFHGRLTDRIKEEKPDLIVITGDLIDKRRTTDFTVALTFVREAAQIAPVYYVPGNHEEYFGRYDELKTELIRAGGTVLDNEAAWIEKNGESLNLIGVMDPNFERGDIGGEIRRLKREGEINLLLCHRPELFEVYAQAGVDLAFSGHAHGGQIRLPGIGGLYAPHQGWWPKLTDGLHQKGETTLCVSRGLGNSLFPLRVFNRPELVVVTVKAT